ncbi:MAG TPA: hypothetical protein VGG03_00800 [Thermoanaerobaculia bacterium]|jgi:hypothetical protein
MLRQPGFLRIAILAVLLLLGGLSSSFAQNCVITRQQVQSDLNAGLSPEEVSAKYSGCTADDSVQAAGTTTAAASSEATGESAAAAAVAPGPTSPSTQIITNTGSTFYEAIKSCGYHPQREELACTIEIRQRFGFGGQICAAPGSHEFVLFCVDYGAGLVPVNINGFHIHDEAFGVNPNWYFAAVVQSDWRLLSLPNNGRTLKARAILSWGWPVFSCTAAPTWGNQADFRIRLDP